jgi:subtilisin family serine protease
MKLHALPLLISLFLWTGLPGQDIEPWNFISLSTCGIDDFLRDHPDYDGRGTVIFVLDTGVDMDIPGLLQTSTGKRKVIDVQDFSGEGDVHLEKAIQLETGAWSDKTKKLPLYGVEKLDLEPVNPNEYYVGYWDETRFKNAEVHDINDNGHTDDVIAVLAFAAQTDTQAVWVAYVDTDLDGEIDDEMPLQDYKNHYDTFHFHRVMPEEQSRPMTFAINITPREKVTFVFTDNSHGTHVAGIAAGYRIGNLDGFNGVAPGAQVVGIKIADGRYGSISMTESMKKAYEYADEYSREYEVPCIINMSFGVGSEWEGQAEIETFLNSLLDENEYLALCLSAGNEGPGLSTIGNPAGAQKALTVGALLSRETASDAYGTILPHHGILHFSSRGGELAKPDIVAPGAAIATVPRYARSGRMWGTSMSSPFAAGSLALLYSGALQEFSDRVPFHLVKRAIINSAQRLDAYELYEQGGGLCQVPAAFELLKKLQQDFLAPVKEFTVSTYVPGAPDSKAPVSYWRSSTLPRDRKISFEVKPVFYENASQDTRLDYYGAFNLTSQSDWLKPVSSSVAIRGQASVTVNVQLDASKMQNPGVYSGKIIAYPKNKRRDNEYAAFDLWVTVIVPERFNATKGYERRFQDIHVDPLQVHRVFVDIPPGASLFSISGSTDPADFCNVSIEICDPAGRTFKNLFLDSDRNRFESGVDIDTQDLTPGIWEVDIYGSYNSEKTSKCRLDIEFWGLLADSRPMSDFIQQIGTPPQSKGHLTNLFAKPFKGSGNGVMDSFIRTITQKLDFKLPLTHTFHLDSSLKGVEFELSMGRKDYAKFTDIALQILDDSGREVASGAMGYFRESLDYFPRSLNSSREYTLKVIPGATFETGGPVDVSITERYINKNKIPLSVHLDKATTFMLVPGIRHTVTIAADGTFPQPPQGFKNCGQIEFYESGTQAKVLVVPLVMD